MRVIHRIALAAASATASVVVVAGVAAAPMAQARTQTSFIGGFHTPPTTVASTVPQNGDVNPYGVAVVRHSQGKLVKNDVLVSNFNNSNNQQGTGTTIVQVAPNGTVTQFAQISVADLPKGNSCPGGIGLTTALVVLHSGFVIVGSLPTTDGTSATAKAGCLLVLNSHGKVVETFSGHGINGPWDMTSAERGDFAELFVTTVLNGTVQDGQNNNATVLRLVLFTPDYGIPQLLAITKIGSGFTEKTDPAALVIGPTGVGLGRDGTLYVADTVGNRIAAIKDAVFRDDSAGTGKTVSAGGALNGPLGLAIAPGGDILTVNSGDGNIVETTPEGAQVAGKTLDTSGSPPGAGALFGLAVAPHGTGVYFVDDATNTLDLLH